MEIVKKKNFTFLTLFYFFFPINFSKKKKTKRNQTISHSNFSQTQMKSMEIPTDFN